MFGMEWHGKDSYEALKMAVVEGNGLVQLISAQS